MFAGRWDHIATTVLSSAAASISFQNINTEYRSFRLTLFAVNDTSAKNIVFRFDSDGGTNYSYQYLYASGATKAAARGTTQTNGQFDAGLQLAASGVGLWMMTFSKPLAGVVARIVVAGGLQTSGGIAQEMDANEWTNTTDLISRIDVNNTSGNFAAGTVAILEGSRNP